MDSLGSSMVAREAPWFANLDELQSFELEEIRQFVFFSGSSCLMNTFSKTIHLIPVTCSHFN